MLVDVIDVAVMNTQIMLGCKTLSKNVTMEYHV
jgi:hypothetical protein